MDGMRMRTIASLLVLGLALWGPGMPLALAQVEVNWDTTAPECRAAFQELNATDPALAAECNRILEACETAALNPETASSEAKAEAAVVTGEIETTVKSLQTVANLETIPADKLQATLTLTRGVDPTVAATIAQEHTKLLERAKAACATGQVGDVEGIVRQVQELYAKAGIDAKSVLDRATRDYGSMSFEMVVARSFEGPIGLGAPDFVGGGLTAARECYVTCDTLKGAGLYDGTGAPPSLEQARAMIEGMNVSADEKAKMVEMAKAYEGFCQEGNFDKIREIQVAAARESYEKMLAEHPGMMTPEMARMMETYHGGPMTMGMERYAQGPMPMDMATMGGTFTPEMMAAMGGGMEHYGSMSSGTMADATANTSDITYRDPTVVVQSDAKQDLQADKVLETLVAVHDHNGDGMPDEWHYTNSDGSNSHAHSSPH